MQEKGIWVMTVMSRDVKKKVYSRGVKHVSYSRPNSFHDAC